MYQFLFAVLGVVLAGMAYLVFKLSATPVDEDADEFERIFALFFKLLGIMAFALAIGAWWMVFTL